MNTIDTTKHLGLPHYLMPVNFEKLAAQLDSVKTDVKSKLGEQDAKYIRRVIVCQRVFEWSGRILLMLGLIG